MQSHISHVQINVRAGNLQFYRELLALLGWRTLCAGDDMIGALGAGATTLWFTATKVDAKNNYDGPGMNHLAFGTPYPDCVDAVKRFLDRWGIESLDTTPRHRPEFAPSGS